MENRIRHLLRDWQPEELPPEAAGDSADAGAAEPGGERSRSPRPKRRPSQGPYPLPQGVNMLMPVELCINRNLLISLLSASITEMARHKRAGAAGLSVQEAADLEAALAQQLAFRRWIKNHPMTFISMALFPVTEMGMTEDLEGLDDCDAPGA